MGMKKVPPHEEHSLQFLYASFVLLIVGEGGGFEAVGVACKPKLSIFNACLPAVLPYFEINRLEQYSKNAKKL